MYVVKIHAFTSMGRPPSWSGTIMLSQSSAVSSTPLSQWNLHFVYDKIIFFSAFVMRISCQNYNSSTLLGLVPYVLLALAQPPVKLKASHSSRIRWRHHRSRWSQLIILNSTIPLTRCSEISAFCSADSEESNSAVLTLHLCIFV
jgi:hypothetical protein